MRARQGAAAVPVLGAAQGGDGAEEGIKARAMTDDPEEDIEETMTSSMSNVMDPRKDLSRLFDEIEWLLKSGGVIAALTARGVNASLGLVAVHGLRAYLIEDKK